MRKQRTLTRLALTLWGVAALAFALTVTTAGAQNPGDPSLLVDDYANYPDTEQTAADPECDAGDILLDQDGAGYSLNGGPLQPTLAALGPLETGDVVTATFVAREDCVGSVVSLTIKNSEQDAFDPTTNQVNVGYESVVAGEGLSTVELTIPAFLDDDCFYQLDHVVGYPLAIVGPDGSFYNPASRGDQEQNMLVDARNGTLTSCTEGTTTTTTGSTTSTTTGSTTSTTQSTTTTSQPTTTTTAPSTTTSTAPTTSTSRPSTTVVVTSPQGQTATSTGRIPQTGISDWLPLLAAVLLVAGVVVEGGALWAKRNRRAS